MGEQEGEEKAELAWQTLRTEKTAAAAHDRLVEEADKRREEAYSKRMAEEAAKREAEEKEKRAEEEARKAAMPTGPTGPTAVATGGTGGETGSDDEEVEEEGPVGPPVSLEPIFDEHGCVSNAGYVWCAGANDGVGKCLRPWEEFCKKLPPLPPVNATPAYDPASDSEILKLKAELSMAKEVLVEAKK